LAVIAVSGEYDIAQPTGLRANINVFVVPSRVSVSGYLTIVDAQLFHQLAGQRLILTHGLAVTMFAILRDPAEPPLVFQAPLTWMCLMMRSASVSSAGPRQGL